MAVLNTKRGGRHEDGFTLIELFVVIAVIGVLVAIGIPTLLGAKSKASNTKAEAAVTQGIKTQKTFFADEQQYTADVSELVKIEPSLRFGQFGSVSEVNDDPQVLGKVFVKNDAGSVVTLVAKSAAGVCYWMRADGSKTYYAKNDCSAEPGVFESGGW